MYLVQDESKLSINYNALCLCDCACVRECVFVCVCVCMCVWVGVCVRSTNRCFPIRKLEKKKKKGIFTSSPTTYVFRVKVMLSSVFCSRGGGSVQGHLNNPFPTSFEQGDLSSCYSHKFANGVKRNSIKLH